MKVYSFLAVLVVLVLLQILTLQRLDVVFMHLQGVVVAIDLLSMSQLRPIQGTDIGIHLLVDLRQVGAQAFNLRAVLLVPDGEAVDVLLLRRDQDAELTNVILQDVMARFQAISLKEEID